MQVKEKEAIFIALFIIIAAFISYNIDELTGKTIKSETGILERSEEVSQVKDTPVDNAIQEAEESESKKCKKIKLSTKQELCIDVQTISLDNKQKRFLELIGAKNE